MRNKKVEKKSPDPYDTYLDSIELDPIGGATDGQAIGYDLIVETPEMSEIEELLKTQSRYSVGVAGPRGSGKTSMLRKLCHSRSVWQAPRERLAVIVSAPIVYEPREFILHLFSSLCDEVLRVNGEKLLKPSWTDIISSMRDSQYPLLRPLTALSAFIGPVLIIVSWIVRSGGLGVLADQEATILLWGIVLSTLGYGIIFWKLLVWLKTKISRRNKPFNEGDMRDTVVEKAKQWLTDIRFQQSYSAGWGGSLKMPVGLETSVSGAITLSAKQLSLPQIVKEYEKFVGLVSDIYQVVIGIDEMDKIEDDDQAQLFLNQIKAIFTSQAFYLISVSEGAMSQFEKKGRPFRTAFDSSFGKIVYVDYLDFGQAMDILGKRVAAGSMPIPFIVLCYCLSGEIARDLIRSFRDLVSRSPGDLMNLVTQSIRSDLDGKLRSMEFEAKKNVGAETGGESFVDKLRNFKTIEISVKALLDAAKELYRDAARFQQIDAANELYRDAARVQQNMNLAYRELGVYLYFYATLLQTFSRRKSSSTWTKEGQDNISVWASSLAIARRSLPENIEIAKRRINSYREAWRMRRPALLQ